MKIICKSNGLTKQDIYRLVSPEDFTPMKEKVGEVLKVKKFILHEEDDMYNGTKKILTIETDNNEIVVSVSRTLTMEFEKLAVIFGVKSINELSIIESQTGMGNDVLSCRLAGMEAL